jgi:predicted transcriptional regulator
MNKMIRYATILVLIIFSWSLVPSGSCEFHNGYTVEPVTPGMDTGTPLETVPVDFWDLPPGIILLSLALSVSSVIGFPVELFFIIKLYAYFGFRKVTRRIVLSNDTRNFAYQLIQDNPGIYFNSLVRKSKLPQGTLRYHLIILRTMGKITIMDPNGNARYFENSWEFSEMEKIVLKYIQNDTDNRILSSLLKNPDANRNHLIDKIGISGPLVSWYIRRLRNDGIITTQKTGKYVHYEITPDARQYLEKYLVLNREPVQSISADQISESA